MLRDEYKALYDQIEPSVMLKNKVMYNQKKNRSKVLLMTAVIIIMLPIITFAVEPQLLYNISPALAQSLKPIMLSCEDQGILMKVISADVDDKDAVVLISFKDTEGNRLNSEFNLYDSFYIKGAFDSSGTIEFVEYDEKEKELIYLVKIHAMQGHYLPKDKITLGFRTILTDQVRTLDYELPIDLTTVEDSDNHVEVEDHQVRGKGGQCRNEKNIVLESHLMMPLEAPEVHLTGIGFIDDRLHVQLVYNKKRELDNHGLLKLVKGDHVIHNKFSLYVVEDKGNYKEYIFDVRKEEIGDYDLLGDFFIYTDRIEGHWEVTFELD